MGCLNDAPVKTAKPAALKRVVTLSGWGTCAIWRTIYTGEAIHEDTDKSIFGSGHLFNTDFHY